MFSQVQRDRLIRGLCLAYGATVYTLENRPVMAVYAMSYIITLMYLPVWASIVSDPGIFVICYICNLNMLFRNMYSIDKYGGVTALNGSERVGYGSLMSVYLTGRLVCNWFGPRLEPNTLAHVLVVLLLVVNSWAVLQDLDDAYQWHVRHVQTVYQDPFVVLGQAPMQVNLRNHQVKVGLNVQQKKTIRQLHRLLYKLRSVKNWWNGAEPDLEPLEHENLFPDMKDVKVSSPKQGDAQPHQHQHPNLTQRRPASASAGAQPDLARDSLSCGPVPAKKEKAPAAQPRPGSQAKTSHPFNLQKLLKATNQEQFVDNMGDLAMTLRPNATKVNLVDWVSWLSVPGLVSSSVVLFLTTRYWRYVVSLLTDW